MHALSTADAGIGAGIDSYYEYCLKAYILLGDEGYLYRFNKVEILCFVVKQLRLLDSWIITIV